MFNSGNKKALVDFLAENKGLSVANIGILTMNSMVQTENNINFEALLSFEVIKQHNDQNLAIMRRIALTPLTRSYEQLVNSTMESEQGGEAFLQVFQITNEYIQYLKDTLELAEASVNRLAIVGQTCLQQMENEQ